MAAYVKARGERQQCFDGMALYSVQDDAGWLTFAENRSSLCGFAVDVDHSESFNVLPSRGSLATHDVVPPGHAQLIQVLTIGGAEDGSSMHARHQYMSAPLSAEAHSPEVSQGIHCTVPLSSSRGGGTAGGRMDADGLDALLRRLGVRFIT